jgi:hypothetical protein
MYKKENKEGEGEERNKKALADFQRYFDRIADSLQDRVSEYMQMKKYIRVYEESNKLLGIDKTINTAAGSFYEINIDKKVNIDTMEHIIQSLDGKNKRLRTFIQKQPHSLQLKLLAQVYKNTLIITNHLQQINKNVARINELIPVIKAILKLPDKEDNFESDPILIGISNALAASIDEPCLNEIKAILIKEKKDPSQYNAKLNFEEINDVSDKLIGLLNDKLLVVIGVSEFLIAGVNDDAANDVPAENRMPEELRALFLASSILDILHRLKELKNAIKIIFNSIKLHLQIMQSEKLGNQYKSLLKNGDNSLHGLISTTLPNALNRLKKMIIEIIPRLDAFELKLKIDALDLDTAIRMTYSLIYDKTNKIWENPYNN